MAEERRSDSLFMASMLLLVAASSTATTLWCRSMSATATMDMPGGWAMSMAWMRMPGQSWPGAAISFTAMWTLMMTAMMSPSLLPVLHRYRRTLEANSAEQPWPATALVGLGYLLVWTAWGILLFPLGAALAQLEMRRPELSRAIPAAVPVILLLAAAIQCSKWKMRRLTSCRHPQPGPAHDAGTQSAFRYGLRLGWQCTLSCANLTAILLVLGVMDLPAMVLVTAMITTERLAPNHKRGAQAVAVGILAMAAILSARAMHLP